MIVPLRTFASAALASVAILSVSLFATSARAAESEPTPPPPVDPQQIAALIKLLGADDYFAREKAQAELVRIGAKGFDILSEELDRTRDIETSERLAYLLRVIRINWVDPADPVEVRDQLQNYEGMDETTRVNTITQLSTLPDSAPLSALCRIVRFERSPMLSKWAAVRIMEQKTTAETDWPAREKLLRTALEGSPRPAAAWVRAYLTAQNNPAAGVVELQKLAEAEEQVLRQYPHRSRPDIVMSLLRRQSELFKKLDRPQDALAALISMVALEQNDATALTEVLETLIERKAWTELDQVVLRFADRIQQDAMVSYTVARAYQLQGKTAEVARYVAAAAKLNAEDQRQHIITAIALHRKGYHEWSDVEYRASIALGRPGDPLTLTAQIMFGEALHERQLDLEAGKILDDASKGMEAAVANGIDLSESGRNLSANRARAHYFYAAHAESQGDSKEQVRHLLEGLGEDPHDTEVLIALYRVKDLHATVRERVIKLIGESIADYRAQIQASPEDDTPYNQLAWLISNTEGDFKEAVQASLKSLEIKPDNPGHLDTLGRCYFALGDYENAVKQQSRAIELDPHSEPMKRQLAEFQAALAKQKAGK